MRMRGSHDLGGLPAGPIDKEPHDMTFWEKQIDAMNTLLAQKGLHQVQAPDDLHVLVPVADLAHRACQVIRDGQRCAVDHLVVRIKNPQSKFG